METPSSRLSALGIDLPAVAPTVAVYIPAVVSGSVVYTASQLPFVRGSIPTTGKLGASELLGAIFGEAGRHARSAVGVAVLPLDAPVEVELVFETAHSGPATR
ncbi:RidA family protein [Microbacterium ulmi]|uniref:RidA family protein n=1 Tax=Microbacterium ulmi TaxID=179095 RepID=A0A7Y2M218_9MICO|nr:RidA family protein [Microbacterium ulmi]NII69517.1 enamine deaminase RidA (YjgF/YER057c/UK114 family) [Microbacterium ulmi]NNH05061.1 RidA family protein [Microbacterium ulmi]